MKHTGLPPQPAHADIHADLPSMDAMLAGTFALMTGYAEHKCEEGNARCRHLMAKKIVSNLFFLASHAQMPQAMALLLRNLQGHWHTLAALGALEDKADTRDNTADRSPHHPNTVMWLQEHTSLQ
jgi:hypothetical protein